MSGGGGRRGGGEEGEQWGRGATAGVFYGAVPFAQALRDVSWSNAALRFAALRSADLHVSDRMIRARIREVRQIAPNCRPRMQAARPKLGETSRVF